ncbi:Ribosomal RNA small subunit methyltransferase A [Quillaja saponaria]|uniref:Ribosomal RNA small subunit methyltransferase A n=1 Tax=Quillaja saponaria TaxID=32244 RepID=A0AAD7PST1_QUISA|nr:Ribosomal RNA small subunit methyltransferase A [Quillaja saponaria]
MAVAFTNLSWWLWSGKHQEPRISNGPAINSSADSGMWESDALKSPLVKRADMGSSSRRVKGKWQSREERKIDREYDVVLVPSDGGCVSGSESDDSDWSIGWLEPHGPGFPSDDEKDNSFAVLVPCYGHGYGGKMEKNNILSNVGNFPNESKKYMEHWLSSLQADICGCR